MRGLTLGLAVAAIGLTGCDEGGYSPLRFYPKSISGPVPVISSDFQPITARDLLNLMDAPAPSGTPDPDADRAALATALARFDGEIYNTNSATTLPNSDASKIADAATTVKQNKLRSERNEIVYHLATISTNLCGEYEQSLKSKSSNVSFLLGSAAVAYGAAGALFTNGTSAIFSGLSGATSGINAEFNKDFFQGLATSIIIPGIEKERTALAQQMAHRMCFGVTTYPLTMAISDVVRFHNACTMDKGIAATSQSVNQSSTIGLDTLESTLSAIERIHNVYKTSSTQTSGRTGAAGNGGTTNDSSKTSNSGSTQPSGDSTGQGPLGPEIMLTQCQPLDKNGLLPSTSSDDTDSTKENDGHDSGTASGANASHAQGHSTGTHAQPSNIRLQ